MIKNAFTTLLLARGLRGEDIEKKLTEVFSNKK